ncbi:MAG: hypothetical protein ACLFVP_00060 [Candidatus Bathyarchaeia archaeon]
MFEAYSAFVIYVKNVKTSILLLVGAMDQICFIAEVRKKDT